MKKVLIVEDDEATVGELDQHFSSKGWMVKTAGDIASARAFFHEHEFNPHVVIADLGLPDGNILEHLEDLCQEIDNTEWIFVCESAEDTDLDLIEELAFDHHIRPIKYNLLSSSANRAYRSAVTSRRLSHYTKSDSKRYHIDSYVGSSVQVVELKSLIVQLSKVPMKTLTITGETGTGKSVIARILHHMGQRKSGPIVELNCSAIPKDMLESEIFGHEAGAFTGAQGRHKGLIEQADGGTLFLDEIGDMDFDLQAKLLTAIEDQRFRRLGGEREQEVDVQVIAATGVDIENAVAGGAFREDLYHRLSVFRLHIPPLRERKEDIIELLPTIVAEYNIKAGKKVSHIPDEVWELLLSYQWPGNVRELRNLVERSVLLSIDENFPVQWMQLNPASTPSTCSNESAAHLSLKNDVITIPIDGSVALKDMDKFIISKALELCNFNVAEAARMLNTSRETMRYRVQKYGLKNSGQVA